MPAKYYQDIYLIIVTILTILVCERYNRQVVSNLQRTKVSQPLFALIIAVFMILFIGFRPVNGHYFVDMKSYYVNYNMILGDPFKFNRDVDNLFYDNWFTWMASKNVPIRSVFVIFATVYFIMMLIACRKFFPRDTLLAFVVCLAAFSTFSYGTNGMKAGMAASTFLVALAYHDKFWISIPLAIFTYGQHHSMSLVIVAYLLVLIVRNPKYYFWIWLAGLLIAALRITYFQHLFAGYTDETGEVYLMSERNSGFRLDFIIYSAVPVIIGYFMIYRYKLKSKNYNLILNLYLTTNSIWMLCMYSDFTNRISYLSWFLYPIVLLYPFLNIYWSNRQAVYLKYVVYGHLFFTLFMTYIYYIFLHA